MKRLLIILALLPVLVFGQARQLTSTYTTGVGSRTMIYSSSLSALRKQATLSAAALNAGLFSFPLSGTANTSAKIEDAQGNLVRTLWNGQVRNSAILGDNMGFWDSRNDAGTLLTSGTYTVRVLTSNTTYDWKGTIGNNSANQTGPDKWSNIAFIGAIATSGNYGYAGLNNGEGGPSITKFLLADPTKRIRIVNDFALSSNDCYFVAVDNTKVYWLLKDSFSKNAGLARQGVIATLLTDDSKVDFPSGTVLTTQYNGPYSHKVADYTEALNAEATGMAVQKSGNYLLVSHGGINELHVSNKTTGALVQNITTFTNPRGLAIDPSDRVWVISSTNTISRHTINSGGTLSAAELNLSGVSVPLALAVSADGAKISVIDGGSAQQIKTFSTTDGSLQNTFPTQAGGYVTNVTVSNDRFYFSDSGGRATRTAITYGANGDFWVIDPGNNRMQHYDASRTFLNRIVFQPHVYNISLDGNNSTRLFQDYLEYQLDYSQPLVEGQGWSLVRNWGATVPAKYLVGFRKLINVQTLSNGRTYGLSENNDQGQFEFVELTANAPRFTGVFVDRQSTLYPNNTIRHTPFWGDSQKVWTSRPITFDGNNNPVLGTATTIASIANFDTGVDPVFGGNYDNLAAAEITSDNRLVSFNAQGDDYAPATSLYRLGFVDVGATAWRSKTMRVTGSNYFNGFPRNGRFDTGNGTNYPGSKALAIGKSVFVGYHGEFHRQAPNWYWQWTSDGLLAGQFGSLAPPSGTYAPAGMAGNAFSMQVAAHPTDANKLLFFHGDESWGSGVHLWEAGGQNTIQTYTRTITLPVTDAKPVDPRGTDLLAGLPLSGSLVSGTAGWVRSPTAENLADPESNYWTVQTGGYSAYDRPNLSAILRKEGSFASGTVSKDLGSVSSADYTFSVELGIGLKGNFSGPESNAAKSFLEVLDGSGKVIARWDYGFIPNTPNQKVTGNGVTLYQAEGGLLTKFLRDYTRPMTMRVRSSGVDFNYDNRGVVNVPLVDNDANWSAPKTIRIYLSTNPAGGGSNRQLVLTEAWLKTN